MAVSVNIGVIGIRRFVLW